MSATLRGKDYRVKAAHPRVRLKDGQPIPLVVTHNGVVIAKAGEVCTRVDPKLLASMLANGYIERVDAPQPAPDDAPRMTLADKEPHA